HNEGEETAKPVTSGGGLSTTVTLAVAWLVAPLESLTVSRTDVTPIGYGPGGDCVMVSPSPSGSNDPSSIDAFAVHEFSHITVTFFALATGGWFGGARVPPQAPFTDSVYCVPAPPPAVTSWTSTANDCLPPGRSNE